MNDLEWAPTDPQSEGSVALKRFADGRVARVTPQIYNVKITISRSLDAPGWEDAW